MASKYTKSTFSDINLQTMAAPQLPRCFFNANDLQLNVPLYIRAILKLHTMADNTGFTKMLNP